MAGGGFKGKRGGFKSAGYNKKRSSPDDEDSTPRTAKKAKGDGDDDGNVLVPRLKEDDEGNSYVALKSNDLRRVTVSDFKGKTLVSIREYWVNDADEVKPGKKGISLTLEQYNSLVAAIPLLESVLAKKGDKTVRPDYDGDPSASAGGDEEEEEEEAGNPPEKVEDDDEEEEE